MVNYQEILNQKVNGVLATVNDGQHQTRVFQSLWAEGNKVFFCTGVKKEVFQQLLSNNKVSYCVENKFSPVLTVNGEVTVTENPEYKNRAFEILPMMEKIYQTPENENFKVFYISIKQVRTFSYAEGPQEFKVEE